MNDIIGNVLLSLAQSAMFLSIANAVQAVYSHIQERRQERLNDKEQIRCLEASLEFALDNLLKSRHKD